jgi:hypothetical protein
MEKFDYWRLCDELSVVHAALLIIGEDPVDYQEIMNYRQPDNTFRQPPQIDCPYPVPTPELPPGLLSNFSATFMALTSDILGKRLRAQIDYYDYIDREPLPDEDVINWNNTSIMVEDLRKWLRYKGVTTGFFFPDIQPGPDYLNSDHNNYSPKLAAAIRSWEAANNDPEFKDNPQHPKQIIISWLTKNAKKFDLVDKNGNVMKKVIEEQIAKVANWRPQGGAPKTQRAKKNLKIKDI